MPNIDTLSIQFSTKGTKTAISNIEAMGVAIKGLASNINSIDAGKIDALANSLKQLRGSAPTKDQTARIVGFGNAISGVAKLFDGVDNGKIQGFANALGTIKSAVPTKNQNENIGGFGMALGGMGNALNSVDGSKLTVFVNGMEQIKSSIPTSNQVTRISDFAVAVKDLSAAIGSANISEFSKDMTVLGSAVEQFKKSSVNSITNAVTAMKNMGQTAVQTANQVANATPKTANEKAVDNNDSIKQAQTLIASLDQVKVKASGIAGIMQKLGLATPTKQFRNLEAQAEKVRAKYEELRATMQKALNSGDIKADSPEYKKKMAQLEGLRNSYNELILKQRELAQEGQAFTFAPNLKQAASGVRESISGVKQAFSGVSSVVQTANGFINTFIGKLRSLGKTSKSTKKETISLSDAAKKLSSELFRVSKMLKLMVTRMALRKVIAEVGNGFKSLAIHSDEFNDSVSGIMNAAKQLGYSFSAMVSPIINALAPAIVYIINLFTKLLNAVQQVFAALTGASTWNKAKQFTDDWRSDIEDANKQAKDLKKTVLGFDELNQLQENKDKSSSGKSNSITDMFDTLPVDKKWKDLATKIKNIAKKLFDPIKKAWAKVGDFVKKNWKYALDELLKLGKDVARDFWKVWQESATQKIFENILIAIGWIGRAIGNLAKQIRKAWNYNNNGLRIFRAIRDIILIITEHIKNMAKVTAEWAEKLDFIPLFSAIASYLESLKPAVDAVMGILEDFYEKVVLKFTKWVIESGLPALIKVFEKFNEKVKWDQLRERLAKLWEHLEPFMETIGEGLVIFIERVTNAIANFINGDKFEDFLTWFGEWMDSVTPNDVADVIEKIVIAIAAFKVLGIVIPIISGIGTAISGLITVCKGIGTIASGIGSVVSALGGFTGLATVGVIITAVALAMYSFVKSYGGFEGAVDKLKTVASDIKTSFDSLVESLGFSDAIDELKKSVEDFVTQLGDMQATWDVIFTVFGGIAKLIMGLVLPIVKDAVIVIGDLAATLTSYMKVVNGVFSVLVGFFTHDADKIISGLKEWDEGVNGTLKHGLDYLEGIAEQPWDAIEAPFKALEFLTTGEIKESAEDIEAIANAMGDAAVNTNELSTASSNLANSNLKGNLDEVGESTKKVTELTSVLKNELKNSYDAANDSAKPFAKTTQDIANEAAKASASLKGTNSSTDKLNQKLTEASGKMSDMKEDTDKMSESVDKSTSIFDKLKEKLNSTKESGEKYNSLADGVKTDSETIDTSVNSLDFGDANKSFEDLLKEASTYYDSLLTKVDENTTDIDSEINGLDFEDATTEFDLFSTDAETSMTDASKAVDEGTKDIQSNIKIISDAFTKDKWTFQGVADGLEETFRRAKNAIKGQWNEIADTLNGEHEVGTERIKIDLPKFAQGGMPEDGLFLANHHELVGKFSNGRTAVANNEQIIQGISAGVYNAVSRANSDSSGAKYIANTIVVDGEVIARSVTKAQERQNMRYSPSLT